MKSWGWAAIAAVALSGAAIGDEELAAENRPAPPFRLPLYNPQPNSPAMLGLDRFVGPSATEPAKALLVDFMASYCKPCKKELPYLQKLQQQYAAQGLRVIVVSIDTEPEGQKKVEELLAEDKITFPVLKDRFKLVARRWLGTQSPLPSVFLVRSDGTIAIVHRGYDEKTSQMLASEVQAALGIKK